MAQNQKANTKMPGQTATTPLHFKINLLSGNNVVLVDCPGYESELFMPRIVNGRINFQNIIPNHRCCDTAAANVQTAQLILPASALGDVRIVPQGTSSPQRLLLEKPIGNASTPLVVGPSSTSCSVKLISRTSKESVPHMLTPEQVRCRPTPNLSPIKVASSLDAVMPPLETSCPPPEMPQLIDTSETKLLANNSMYSPNSTLTRSSQKTDSAICNFMHKAPPARTYAHRGPKTTNQTKSPIKWSPLPKKKLSKVSATKPPSPRIKLEVRRRKLVVDQKRTLNSKKLQNVAPTPITKAKIRRTQVTGKTRQQFEALKGTAFDLLTNPVKSSVAINIQKVFQAACVEKYSETLPNYAELAVTTPLEIDRQVRAIIAKEKRLEKQMTKLQQADIVKKNAI